MQASETARRASELPTGTVTFLFTDIEASTRLVQRLGDGSVPVLAEHQRILRKAVAEQEGREIDNQGDSFFFAFERANAALGAAVLAQRALSEHSWPEGGEVRVRMGMHTDEPIIGEERYVGLGVHRAARIGSVAHGGQVLLSNATRELVEHGLAGVSIRDLGLYRLKDLDRDERLYQLDVAGLRSDFPPLKAQRVAEPLAASPTEVEPGAEFLGYRIEERIGQGGMGVVYRAYDLRLRRTVALKLVTPELAVDERFRERFVRETELAMALEHPNVVPIHDAGEVVGRLYLAMRLVSGTDLRKLLRAEGALEPSRALAICRQVANALDAAHAAALVHRDVKPSNVLLDDSEHVYLADFGLTRRLEERGPPAGEARSIGTPAYLAPEQIEDRSVDGRADVYSLGCILFECLTGRPPFRHGSRLEVAWAHLEEEPPQTSEHNSELPQAIDAVVRKALAKQPADRYQTCASLVDAAEEALGFRTGQTRTSRWPLLAAGLAAVVAVAAGAVLLRSGNDKPTVVPDSLVKVDARTHEVVDVFPVGRDTGVVALVGRYVFVANDEDGTLTRIERSTGELVTSGRYDAGRGIAGQGAKWLWVGSPNRHEVTRADVEWLGDRDDGSSEQRVPIGKSSGKDTLVEVGERSLWISATPTVQHWRLRPLRRERTYALKGREHALDIAFGYGSAWVSLGSPADALLRIDTRTGVARRIPVGSFPIGSTAGFASLWVAMRGDDEVWRLDPVTGRPQAVIATGDGAMDVAVGRGSIWVTNQCDGTISRIDPDTNEVTDKIDLGYHPQWLAADNDFVWVGVAGSDRFIPVYAGCY
jgi:YVTN family beta-propeller protein